MFNQSFKYVDIRALRALLERRGEPEMADLMRDAYQEKRSERARIAPKKLVMRHHRYGLINVNWNPPNGDLA